MRRWPAQVLVTTACLWWAACSGSVVRPDVPAKPPGPDAHTLFTRALAAQEAGDRSQAEALWKQVMVAAPNYAAPHTNLGILYRTNGRILDAISEYETAVRLDPADAAAYHNLGLAHRARGAWAEAERAYLRALELRPNQVETHYNLGILYDLFLNKPTDALAQYRAVVALGGPAAQVVDPWIRALERRLAQPDSLTPEAP